MMYQLGVSNVYYNVGRSQILDNDTARQIIQPIAGGQAGNFNFGLNSNLDYLVKGRNGDFIGLIGLCAKNDFGIIWNSPATSLVTGYLIRYYKMNLALSLGLKQRTRNTTVIYKANLPFFILQHNQYESSNPTLPLGFTEQSYNSLTSRVKYVRQIAIECAVFF